ncbi:MAG: CRTAC1 family protein, partial [Bacteroidota bacterium]
MMNRFLSLSAFFVAMVLVGCDSNENKDTSSELQNSSATTKEKAEGFESLDPDQTGILFSNFISETEEVNHLEWDAVYYGGGVAIGDVNNDGLPDVYLCGNQVNDALYLNQGDFQFKDISIESGIANYPGWSNGVSMADVNGDGWMDVYVCRSSWLMDKESSEARENKLFLNQQDGTFKEVAKEWGVNNQGYSTQASFLDFDHDGDLDMFLLNAPSNNLDQKVRYAQTGFPDFAKDLFFENVNGQSFNDITDKAGVGAFSFGLGVIASDLNHDGWVDIYVANDYERPDYLYINQRDGTFSNELNDLIKHTCFTAMGCESSDLNNDGFVDLTVLDMQSPDHQRSKTNMPSMQPEVFWDYVQKGYNHQYMTNVLQVNNGRGFFSDVSQYAGIASTDWSWAVLGFDADQDGLKDLYITNGINRDIRNNDFALSFQEKLDNNEQVSLFDMVQETPVTQLSNYFFHNKGDFQFNKTQKEMGLDQPSFSFGAAYGDLDNDGDLDLIVNNNNEPPFVYRNSTANNNWLQVKTDAGTMNPFGYGSKAIIHVGNEIQYQECTPVRGYQSSCEPMMHFGLGNEKTIDSLLVIFPDGTSHKEYNVKANQMLEYSIAIAKKQPINVYQFPEPSFQDYTAALGDRIEHKENDFDDFAREILLPHKQSDLGPAMAVADVNG